MPIDPELRELETGLSPEYPEMSLELVVVVVPVDKEAGPALVDAETFSVIVETETVDSGTLLVPAEVELVVLLAKTAMEDVKTGAELVGIHLAVGAFVYNAF